ncbi:putative MFS family arabinose efflux permease [Rhodococcus sp. 27YEA15]|uniref:MFS transporter n=1 Tax=Rhodococcus sp. 27YEA15 TaxID=3156259 RepID=UPI003C79D601
MEKNPEFPATTPSASPVSDAFSSNGTRLWAIAGVVALATVSLYMALYMPTYAIVDLGMDSRGAFVSTLVFGTVLFVASPLFGALSDRAGAARVMVVAAAASMIVAIPLFVLISTYPVLPVMILIEVVSSSQSSRR